MGESMCVGVLGAGPAFTNVPLNDLMKDTVTVRKVLISKEMRERDEGDNDNNIKTRDCEIEEYVLRDDVKIAINKLKQRYPNFVPAIDKTFERLV